MFGNTKKRGRFVIFAYREKANYYLGVNLTFNLLVEGSTLEEVIQRIQKITEDYIKLVRKNNWSDDLLNQPAPEEYWEKCERIVGKMKWFKELKERIEGEKRRQYWEAYFRTQLSYFKTQSYAPTTS